MASRLLDDLHRDTASSQSPPSRRRFAARSPALLLIGARIPGSGGSPASSPVRSRARVPETDRPSVDPDELCGDPAEAVSATLRREGPPLLFERVDEVILRASEPAQVVEAVLASREDDHGRVALIATCSPEAYARLKERFPELVAAFGVFRLPDVADVEVRMALAHALAVERRVTISAAGRDVVRADLPRLSGRDSSSARAWSRLTSTGRWPVTPSGWARHGIACVLTPEDFAGVAEEIEPALRPPGTWTGSCGRCTR